MASSKLDRELGIDRDITRRDFIYGSSLFLDDHPIFGGEAKRKDFEVNGVHISGPQGSNDFWIHAKT